MFDMVTDWVFSPLKILHKGQVLFLTEQLRAKDF